MARGEGLGPLRACDERPGGFDLLVVGRAGFWRCLKGEHGLGGVCRPQDQPGQGLWWEEAGNMKEVDEGQDFDVHQQSNVMSPARGNQSKTCVLK